MEHSIINEVVILDENGDGKVKYTPIKKNSIILNKPATVNYNTGKLKGQLGEELVISYISLYDGDLGE